MRFDFTKNSKPVNTVMERLKLPNVPSATTHKNVDIPVINRTNKCSKQAIRINSSGVSIDDLISDFKLDSNIIVNQVMKSVSDIDGDQDDTSSIETAISLIAADALVI